MKKIYVVFIISLFLVCFSYSPVYSQQIENVIGFGVGLPYGGLVGLNYELGITDYFAPTAGVGYALEDVGWNVGARLYYPGRRAKFRGRITVLYGTNSVIDDQILDEFTTDEGLSVGLGLNWRYSENWAFDFDLFYIDSDAKEKLEEKYRGRNVEIEEYGGDIKIALGFNYRW